RDCGSLVHGLCRTETEAMDKSQLADFLRRRREALQPEDVGLTRGPRRRAEGLRREEVAALCDMSVDYYSRLEQSRGPQPSEQTELGETLAHTPADPGLFGDETRYRGFMRSVAYRWFMDLSVRGVYPIEDHPMHSRAF